MTMGSERFGLERVIDEAVLRTGLEDFGEATWREGLVLLLDDLANEARLHELGVDIAAGEIIDYLSIRLGITDYRKHHPAITSSPIARPIVIVGQPRTGTTILYDLLAQDPRLRAPLSWEVDKPLPPPDPGTYGTDPRIAEVQAAIDLADTLIPGFTSFHPMGALHAQECVRITAGDFRSMIFNTQYRVPNYNRWLLEQAELGPAYRWHRHYLQHLQARQPAQRWLLKSPAHLWHLNALAAEYPDAVIIQTHRDPLKVVASVSALVAHLRRMASDETSVAEAGRRPAVHRFHGEPLLDDPWSLRPPRPRADGLGRAADAHLPRGTSGRRRRKRHPLQLRQHRVGRRRPPGTGAAVPGPVRCRVRTDPLMTATYELADLGALESE
jgi:hypothetical protein